LSILEKLLQQFSDTRKHTLFLCQGLDIEEYNLQAMQEVSPPKWHLAHTTWFFETFILNIYHKNYKLFNENFSAYFNSYYDGIGYFHPRCKRGLLTKPYLREIHAYRQYVDAAMQSLMQNKIATEIQGLIMLGIHHEKQHQELLLMDMKYNLWSNPCRRNFGLDLYDDQFTEESTWLTIESSLYEIGTSASDFHFDNEAPRHKFYLQPYRIASTFVSNQDYLDFINDGAYQNPLLWLSDGWDWIASNNIQLPLYWIKQDEQFFEFTLCGLQSLRANKPILHLNYFEADAYARWRGCRLPTEQEWEVAAQQFKFKQDIGWQWTSSAYSPYPGFIPFSGKATEFNGKFMCQQMVLRGGSAASPEDHLRYTYRNFFAPYSRWQFSALRLANTIED